MHLSAATHILKAKRAQEYLSIFFQCHTVGAAIEQSILRSRTPDIATVEDNSNIPLHDIGNYLGLPAVALLGTRVLKHGFWGPPERLKAGFPTTRRPSIGWVVASQTLLLTQTTVVRRRLNSVGIRFLAVVRSILNFQVCSIGSTCIAPNG